MLEVKILSVFTDYKFILLLLTLGFISCESNKEKERRLYHKSLAKEFELNKANGDENTTHDSLVMVAAYKQKVLSQLDSLGLLADSIRAKYEFQSTILPKKVEFGLMRAEEATNDIRLKIRHSKEAAVNWKQFQDQIDKEIDKIRKTLAKL